MFHIHHLRHKYLHHTFRSILIKKLERFCNCIIKEHGIRLTRSHKYGYNCSIDFPRCVGLSPTKNMLTKLLTRGSFSKY